MPGGEDDKEEDLEDSGDGVDIMEETHYLPTSLQRIERIFFSLPSCR